MNEKRTILFVGAHNEEIETCCPVLACKLSAKGHRVIILNPVGGWNWWVIREMGPGAEHTIRSQAIDAAAVLGCEKILWDYPCGKLSSFFDEITRKIAEVLFDINPDFVFVHWPYDSHPDHRMIAKATWQALHYGRDLVDRQAGEITVKETFAYHAFYNQTYNFWPDFLVLAEEHELVRCERAIACFQGYAEEMRAHWWQYVQTIQNKWKLFAGKPAEPYKYLGPRLPLYGLDFAGLLEKHEIKAITNECWTFRKDFTG